MDLWYLIGAVLGALIIGLYLRDDVRRKRGPR